MKESFRRFAHNYKEGGVAQIAHKLVTRIRTAVWSETNWLVYGAETARYDVQSHLSLTREELDLDRMRELGYFKALAFPERTQARLERGETSHGFFLDGTLAHVTWSRRDKLNLENGVAVDCPGAGVLYDSLTFPPFRGKGIYPEALGILAEQFRDTGLKSVVIAVDPGNASSIKGIEKAGFKPIFRLTRKLRLGTSRLRRDAELGAQGRSLRTRPVTGPDVPSTRNAP